MPIVEIPMGQCLLTILCNLFKIKVIYATVVFPPLQKLPFSLSEVESPAHCMCASVFTTVIVKILIV